MTAVNWLLENADAVVRYRTQTELINIADKEQLQDGLAAVLALPQTQKRISLLGSLWIVVKRNFLDREIDMQDMFQDIFSKNC